MTLMLLLGIFWIFLAGLVFGLPGPKLRRAMSIAPPLMVLSLMAMNQGLSPAVKLLLAFPAVLLSLKASLLLLKTSRAQCIEYRFGTLIYLSVWPGFDVEPFLKARQPQELEPSRFTRGYVLMSAGLVAAICLSIFWPHLAAGVGGLAGIAVIITTVHLGYCDVLSSLLMWAGYPVKALFNSPWRSTSLRDFWNLRWNIAFVEMNRQLFTPLLRRFFSIKGAVFAAFVLSGLLHELAISYPAGAGVGGPLIYFLIQGAACMVETRLFKNKRPSALQIAWTWTILLVPAPLLFTAQFRGELIEPMFQALHGAVTSIEGRWLLDKLVWLAAAGNFLTMFAGVQVPKRLNWKEQLAMLTPFNRKVFLNYYAFTGGVIAAWALLTIGLHDEILSGQRAAGLVCLVVALFWGARVAVDAFYFKHSDWPAGSELVVGHALLTTLFVCLTASYGYFALHCFGVTW